MIEADGGLGMRLMVAWDYSLGIKIDHNLHTLKSAGLRVRMCNYVLHRLLCV